MSVAGDSLFDPVQARAFLARIGFTDRSVISLWNRQDRRTDHVVGIDAALVVVERLVGEGRDVYVGLAQRRAGLTASQRGGIADVVSLGCYWLDVDRMGPGHVKENLPATEDDLIEILKAGPPPQMIVDSGGGWHVYWTFPPEAVADPDAMNACTRAWQERFRARAAARGWHLDATGNLDRVLRVPGTGNFKSADAPPAMETTSEAK